MAAMPTILVVDDHPVNRRLMEAILRKSGYGLVLAEDGAQAVQAVQQGGISLILMDLMMPVMDGFEATAAIRETEDGLEIPIIAVTADVTAGIRERCRLAGFDGYIAKPFTGQHLLSVIFEKLGSNAC